MRSDEAKPPEHRIDFLKSAASELARVSRKDLPQLADAIDGLKRDPRPPGHIILNGYEKPEDQPPILRITVGNYRVIYRIKERFSLVTVLKIGDRSTVYPDFAALMGRTCGKPSRKR